MNNQKNVSFRLHLFFISLSLSLLPGKQQKIACAPWTRTMNLIWLCTFVRFPISFVASIFFPGITKHLFIFRRIFFFRSFFSTEIIKILYFRHHCYALLTITRKQIKQWLPSMSLVSRLDVLFLCSWFVLFEIRANFDRTRSQKNTIFQMNRHFAMSIMDSIQENTVLMLGEKAQ